MSRHILYGLSALMIAYWTGCSEEPINTDVSLVEHTTSQPSFTIPPPVWGGSTTVQLVAGRSTVVGKISASIENGHLLVTYTTNAPWLISQSHLDVQVDLGNIPQTPNGQNPIPGQFVHKRAFTSPVSTTIFQLPISWQPGDTLHIAAHAEVLMGNGNAQSAWGAGTRFNDRGSWGTYFTFTPDVQAVVAHGDHWLLMRVAGRTEEGEPFNDGIYIVQGSVGIEESPLPFIIKADLLNGITDGDLFQVSQNAVNQIIGQYTANPLTVADPSLGICSDKPIQKSKTVDLNNGIPLYSGTLGGNSQASVSIGGNIQGSVTGVYNGTQKKALCIPYALRFDNLHVYGNAFVNHGVSVTGTVNYGDAWYQHLVTLELFDLWFSVFLVPVRLKVEMPISVGGSVSASVTAQATYTASQITSGSFDYVCNKNGCNGGSNFHLGGSELAPQVTASVSGRVQPSVFAEVGIRASLYDDSVANFQVDVRPYLHADFWGYFGNNCGDGDNDGILENVQALTLDLDWNVQVNAKVNVFENDLFNNTVYDSGRQHIGFWDLIGSNALTPEIKGASTAVSGISSSYEIGMRPCWPYDDRIAYQVDWGDGSSLNLSDAYAKAQFVQKTWNQAGTYPVSVLAINDKHGRPIGQTTSRDILVGGGGGGGPQAIPLSVNAVSASCPSYPPSNAVDGDPETSWNACDWPTPIQFIEVDLGAMRQISKIRLLTEQNPPGVTNHSVYGRDSFGNFAVFYGDITGHTTHNQWLELTTSAMDQVRYIYIVTSQSPSWVAWREIEVYAP